LSGSHGAVGCGGVGLSDGNSEAEAEPPTGHSHTLGRENGN
jgi:hypothetical protein